MIYIFIPDGFLQPGHLYIVKLNQMGEYTVAIEVMLVRRNKIAPSIHMMGGIPALKLKRIKVSAIMMKMVYGRRNRERW